MTEGNRERDCSFRVWVSKTTSIQSNPSLMSATSMATSSVVRQLSRLTSSASRHLTKPQQRALYDWSYGIVASGSPLISEAMRVLAEPIAPKKSIERLGRHLENPRVAEAARNAILKDAVRQMKGDFIIAVDPTDMAKPHARAMPHLGRVRDGSTGEIVQGYPALASVLAWPGEKRWLPLGMRLYSHEAGKRSEWSENLVILSEIERIMAATGGRGTIVIDRGGDRSTLMTPMLKKGTHFVIRQLGNRHILWGGEKLLLTEVAAQVKCRTKVVEEDPRAKETRVVRLGSTTVYLPGHPDIPLTLTVCRTEKHKPMMLLSTHTGWGRKHVLRIFSMYRARWRVEEAIFFMKQELQWERIRVLKWERMKALSDLVCFAAYFLASRLARGLGETLVLRVLVAVYRPIYSRKEGCALWAATKGLQKLLQSRAPPQGWLMAA